MDNCSICGKTDWHDLDYLRNREYWVDTENLDIDTKLGFRICKNCGYVNYEYRPDGALKEHYKTDRKNVHYGNLRTTYNKLAYHRAFLKEYLKPDMTVIDIGCATGGFLDILHNEYGISHDNLYGTEWGDAFVAFAKGYYKLKNIDFEIQKEWPKKYDLVCYYHVLEHIQAPEKELMKVRDMVADGGYVYVSVPVWFERLVESSMSPLQGQEEPLEQHYHLNHINVFSRQSFNNLLRKCGFEVVKVDDVMYAYTVLLKKVDPKDDIVLENYLEKVQTIEKQKTALQLMKERRNKEAEAAFPMFPEIYIALASERDAMKEFKEAKAHIERGLALMPTDVFLLNHYAKLHFTWDENTPSRAGYYSNNIKIAERTFNQIRELKGGDFPECDYFQALIEAKYKQNYRKAIEYMENVYKNDVSRFPECINYIAKFHYELAKEAKN